MPVDMECGKMADAFTAKQLADWKRFEKVRTGGRYNMYDPKARKATGLSSDEYRFVMRNFSALREAVKEAG